MALTVPDWWEEQQDEAPDSTILDAIVDRRAAATPPHVTRARDASVNRRTEILLDAESTQVRLAVHLNN